MSAMHERRVSDRRDEAPGEVGYGIDRRGTGERSEMRFLVPRDAARDVERTARANLKPGDVEADAPWYTTTYCDTADRRIYRSAERGSGSLLRMREYHSRRPERALASRRVWIEWKDEHGERSKKERFVVRPADIGPFLGGEGDASARVGIDVAALFGPLAPVVVTQCRRVAYSSRRDDIRITFDHELTYFAPDEPSSDRAVQRQLGPILASEPEIVVELKWQQVRPPWLADLLADLRDRAADRPPKFVVAMRHLIAHAGRAHAGDVEVPPRVS